MTENVITNVDVYVPEWVNWIATDRDGFVNGFEHKPVERSQMEYWESTGREAPLYAGKPKKNWNDSLVEWK